ncbi:MAG: hypothetical protein ACKOYM_01010, partial [Actinomycetes bacterium]
AARRRGLRPPVFRSPPRIDGVDRTIRRRPDGVVVVAVRLADRPFAAVQADVVEGVVVANELDAADAARFRQSAWSALAPLPDGARRAVPTSEVPGVPDVSTSDASDPGPSENMEASPVRVA